MNKNIEQKDLKDWKINSKIWKILKFYYKEQYKNFDLEKIQARIVDVDIYLQLVSQTWKRPEYKLYIQPIKWLPSIYIKNPAVFFVFCIIHSFLPNINSIIIKNSNTKLDITQYKKIVLINRMLHLFFVKWFNFVLYDVIRNFLKDPFIKELFEENSILPLSEAEILYLVKTIEDIKKSWFDLNKHHFHEQLWKLNNEWTFSENMFLEVAIKYENKIREHLWYDATYIKPASYVDDTENKTDFNWIFSIKKDINKYRSIPIQFTVYKDIKNGKLNWVIHQLFKSNHDEFIYIQVDWEFRKNIINNIELYKEWIYNVEKRQSQDLTQFPLFINHEKGNIQIKELIISYFCLHHIMKHLRAKNIPKLKLNVDWIDLNKIIIKKKEKNMYNLKIKQVIYSLYEGNKFAWKIVLLQKNKDNKK